jgi:hypothetical protein
VESEVAVSYRGAIVAGCGPSAKLLSGPHHLNAKVWGVNDCERQVGECVDELVVVDEPETFAEIRRIQIRSTLADGLWVLPGSRWAADCRPRRVLEVRHWKGDERVKRTDPWDLDRGVDGMYACPFRPSSMLTAITLAYREGATLITTFGWDKLATDPEHAAAFDAIRKALAVRGVVLVDGVRGGW